MYTPNCFYCGRNNHKTNACRYREIDLARITRDPGTGKLKKHFNRKPNHPTREDRRPKGSSTSSSFTNFPRPHSKHNSCESDNKSTNKHKTSPKPALPTSQSKPINPDNYLRCKDCITWSMRLHTQANYWREEYKRLEKSQNIIDSLTKENMNLRKERNHWKDLYYLSDRDNLKSNQIVRRKSKPKN